MIRFVLFSFLICTIFSCGYFKEKEPSIEYLAGKVWVLTSIGNIPVTRDAKTTIAFSENNQISGNAGCNQYFGTFDLSEGSFSVSGIGSTRKMCPENVMTQEQNYLITLEGANSIKLFGDNLVINSDEVFQKLKFTSQN